MVGDAGRRRRWQRGEPRSHDSRRPATIIWSSAHAVHLDPQGILSLSRALTQLGCASCHTTPAGRAGRMKPIVMEEHCASCHDLRFEPRHPEWTLPHGQPKRVVDEIVESHYSQMALAGEATGIASRAGWKSMASRAGRTERDKPRRLPGRVTARSRPLATTLRPRCACGLCHQVNPPTGSDPLGPGPSIPVLVPTTYSWPKAHFLPLRRACHPTLRAMPRSRRMRAEEIAPVNDAVDRGCAGTAMATKHAPSHPGRHDLYDLSCLPCGVADHVWPASSPTRCARTCSPRPITYRERHDAIAYHSLAVCVVRLGGYCRSACCWARFICDRPLRRLLTSDEVGRIISSRR